MIDLVGDAAVIGSLSMISCLTFFPIIFNYFVISKIEKRMGTKLEYSMITYDIIPFSIYLGKFFDIAFYILIKHFFYWIGFKNITLPDCYALQKINYSPEQFSWLDLIMSYLVLITIIVICICGYIVHTNYVPH